MSPRAQCMSAEGDGPTALHIWGVESATLVPPPPADLALQVLPGLRQRARPAASPRGLPCTLTTGLNFNC